MSVKRVLFIDDGSIDEIVERLRRNLKRRGFTLIKSMIDLNQPKFKKKSGVGSKETLDFQAIKDELIESYANEPLDLIACDYHYANDELDGYKILGWLKNESRSKKHRIRRAKFCLYSSEGDKLAKKTNSIEDLSKLIRHRFDDFLKRENLANDLSGILLKEEEKFDFSKALDNELSKFPDFKFKSVYPKFEGKEISEIIQEMTKETHHGIKFQQNLVELTIAHFIELNKEEK
ncbi:hypothetical protein [Aquimarina sp. RZ0]|uniref:hypothetical protein n=1 Tax=Aquimarina sp. RZ0 TaxID=2607730 RepID=UPI0011F1D240|nr:hypothetical protein [Aquimarina sp. RZ0]KAA1242902.1 hypothetical protein F0000_23485 [Aquimarina sp. RZ0]